MPSQSEARQIPVRVKMRLEAIGLWAFLSIPSVVVTICLFVTNLVAIDEEVRITRKVHKVTARQLQSALTQNKIRIKPFFRSKLRL